MTCTSPTERARKNERVILQALAGVGQNQVAAGMGISESSISRFKESGIAQAAALLAHCGLKVVSASARCFDPEYVTALKTLAEVGLRQQPPSLRFEDIDE